MKANPAIDAAQFQTRIRFAELLAFVIFVGSANVSLGWAL